jgi:hypothetical protein
MKRKYCIKFIFFGILLCLLLLSCDLYNNFFRLPKDLKSLFFEKSEFAKPITASIPESDSPSNKDRILDQWKKGNTSTFFMVKA